MKKLIPVFLFISLFLGVSAYITSTSLYLGVFIFILFFIYFTFILSKTLNKYNERIRHAHECHNFINSFLITLSVKSSIDEAFSSATRLPSIDLEDFLLEIKEDTTSSKLETLREYFNLAVYRLFLDVLKIYIEQGGDILQMSNSLVLESTRIEKSLINMDAIAKRKLGEFVVLWIITIGILFYMRFGLSYFYMQMVKSSLFTLLLGMFFMVLLFSIHFFALCYCKLSLKEDR